MATHIYTDGSFAFSPTSLMTELDAVNLMLECIGELPVTTTEETPVSALALTMLIAASRDVQTKSWYFNEEDEVEFAPVNEAIVLATNVLKVVATSVTTVSGASPLDIIRRGNALYDKKGHTNVFNATDLIKATVTYFLEFTEMPQAARTYIGIKAARLFQKRVLGSESLHKLTEEDEQAGWLLLLDEEMEQRAYSITNFNISMKNRG